MVSQLDGGGDGRVASSEYRSGRGDHRTDPAESISYLLLEKGCALLRHIANAVTFSPHGYGMRIIWIVWLGYECGVSSPAHALTKDRQQGLLVEGGSLDRLIGAMSDDYGVGRRRG